jgi:hypothetical protein
LNYDESDYGSRVSLEAIVRPPQGYRFTGSSTDSASVQISIAADGLSASISDSELELFWQSSLKLEKLG